jgi:PIN domain nuclease of toxin-antitoxin system
LQPGEFAPLIDSDHDLCLSAVSIWELRIKWCCRFGSGDRKGLIDPAHLLTAVMEMGLPVEPFSPTHCAARLTSLIHHRDPFDELLLTIAQKTEQRLFTRDEALRGIRW